ncbi:dihydropteroate synthase [soil metagenome]
MIWRTKRGEVDLSRRGLVMGVLNVTPDSFSDGGAFLDHERALAHGLELVADGSEIIDIGGESTRPGAESVGEVEELRRVVPVIRALRAESEVLISVDTSKAAVAEAAVEAGADIINDVTALQGDGRMMEVAAQSGAGVVLMHMQGNPRTMQKAPHYEDVVGEVVEFLRQRMEAVLRFGMAAESIAIDPGIGFGKTLSHNLALLRALPRFAELGRPVLIGVSRKSFLSKLDTSLGEGMGDAAFRTGRRHSAAATAPGTAQGEMDDRFWQGVALTSFGRERGARIFRVHEPKPHGEALRMTEAMLGDA